MKWVILLILSFTLASTAMGEGSVVPDTACRVWVKVLKMRHFMHDNYEVTGVHFCSDKSCEPQGQAVLKYGDKTCLVGNLVEANGSALVFEFDRNANKIYYNKDKRCDEDYDSVFNWHAKWQRLFPIFNLQIQSAAPKSDGGLACGPLTKDK